VKTDTQNHVTGTSQDRMSRSSRNGDVRNGDPHPSGRTDPPDPGVERAETRQQAPDVERARELYSRTVDVERAPAEPEIRSSEEAASLVATLREQVQAEADKAYQAQAKGLPRYLAELLS